MKKNNNKGFIGVDMTIAVMAMTFFSIIIISLIYSNHFENLKTKKEALAVVYITEILENIGIEDYDNVTAENVLSLIPTELEDYDYDVKIEVDSDPELSEDMTEQIVKKVKVQLSYKVGDKNYKYSMERIKVKE